MKKAIFVFIYLQCVFGSAFSQNTAYLSRKWSLEEVKNMVKKYNLQDSVTATKNNGLMYDDKAEIDAWCKKWVAAIAEEKEFKNFLSGTAKVRNVADYFRLLDNHPIYKQSLIIGFGGTLAFQKYKDRLLKSSWRIYRSNKGGLSFENARSKITETEKLMGNRIDNLPKE